MYWNYFAFFYSYGFTTFAGDVEIGYLDYLSALFVIWSGPVVEATNAGCKLFQRPSSTECFFQIYFFNLVDVSVNSYIHMVTESVHFIISFEAKENRIDQSCLEIESLKAWRNQSKDIYQLLCTLLWP